MMGPDKTQQYSGGVTFYHIEEGVIIQSEPKNAVVKLKTEAVVNNNWVNRYSCSSPQTLIQFCNLYLGNVWWSVLIIPKYQY